MRARSGHVRQTGGPDVAKTTASEGTRILKDWGGATHEVLISGDGGATWNGQSYSSLSTVARAMTGTNRNGSKFFGGARRSTPMIRQRCAIYTRKSTEEGLDQNFNSLDAQREACAANIPSQTHEGWAELSDRHDDGGFSGGSMDRAGLKQLLKDVQAGRIGIIVVYKVDRLTRSLSGFAKMVDLFDGAGVSFVSVNQAFNTTSSIGRLTLNVLLSFAQFEREVPSGTTAGLARTTEDSGLSASLERPCPTQDLTRKCPAETSVDIALKWSASETDFEVSTATTLRDLRKNEL